MEYLGSLEFCIDWIELILILAVSLEVRKIKKGEGVFNE